MANSFLSAKYNADLLTVDYVAGDGTHLLRTGGTIAWRFNNPGNLRPSKKGIPTSGAIGVGRTKTNGEFLIFASYADGRKQKKALLRNKYNGRTIYTMLAGETDGAGNLTPGYAPASDQNDPRKYAGIISARTGLAATTKLSEITDMQLEVMMDAMESYEGYHGKPETRQEKIINATTITISDGAQPKPGTPVKLEIAGQTQITKTNERGQLPQIPHTDIGKSATIFLPTVDGQWEKVFDFVMKAESRSLLFSNGVKYIRADTDLKILPGATSGTKRKSSRYVIQSGDTIGKLAKRFKTTAAEIRRDNPHIKDTAKIYPSQILIIDGDNQAVRATGKTKPAPAPAAAHRKGSERGSVIATPARSNEGKGQPLALIETEQQRAPWMEIAIAEAKKWKGETEETIAKTSNYHESTGATFLKSMSGSKNAWCASFINYCISNCSPPYAKWKNSFRAGAVALDTATFVEIETAVYGAIALVGTHHVTLVYAKSGDKFACLGGNQADQINFSYFKKNLRFFVPLAYHEFATKDISLGNTLADYTPGDLNKAFGITVKDKKKDALT